MNGWMKEYAHPCVGEAHSQPGGFHPMGSQSERALAHGPEARRSYWSNICIYTCVPACASLYAMQHYAFYAFTSVLSGSVDTALRLGKWMDGRIKSERMNQGRKRRRRRRRRRISGASFGSSSLPCASQGTTPKKQARLDRNLPGLGDLSTVAGWWAAGGPGEAQPAALHRPFDGKVVARRFRETCLLDFAWPLPSSSASWPTLWQLRPTRRLACALKTLSSATWRQATLGLTWISFLGLCSLVFWYVVGVIVC